MAYKKIEQYRKQLIEIIERRKQPDGNPAKGTKKDLQELAKRVGASTRAIYTGPDGWQKGYDAGISDLIDNIHTALQMAATIDMGKTAEKNNKIAKWTAWIALIGVAIGFLVANRANNIAFGALRKAYTPWPLVTFIRPILEDQNNFTIDIKCKNFSGGPALNFNITYDILGDKIEGQKNSFDSDILMPGAEGNFQARCNIKDGRAKQIVDKMNNGELSLGFNINYEDIFGRKMEIRQERRWIKDRFRNIRYDVIKR